MKRPRRIFGTGGILACTSVLITLVFGSFEHLTSKPDIRSFDPKEMGRMEAGMWRSYYGGRWGRLGWLTLEVAHRQYGFSWWDSLRMATHAARAALYFRKNTDDPRCLPELEAYYGIIRQAMRGTFDVSQAARLELDWWKERRWNIPSQDYARMIARLTSLLFDVPEESVLLPSTLRAQAMAYRDARRDGKMTDSDWQEVTRQLILAYASLKESVTNGR